MNRHDLLLHLCRGEIVSAVNWGGFEPATHVILEQKLLFQLFLW